jgi:hypothetical protein
MRYLFLITLLLSAITFSNAQDDGKLIVGVTKFKSESNPQAEKYSSSITERVLDILKNSNRFTVIDLTSEDARKEVLDRASENYKADNWIDANKGINAEYTIAADISTLKFIHFNGQPSGYKVSIGFVLKIIQTETGKVIGTKQFQSLESKMSLTPEGALLAAMNTIEDDLKDYFDQNFQLKTIVVRVQDSKNNEAKSVLIDAGSTLKLKKGSEFKVYTIDKSLAKPLEVSIGTIKLESDIDENYSLCKVTNGGDKIQATVGTSVKVYCKLIK